MFTGYADEIIKLNEYYLRHPLTWIVFGLAAVMLVAITAIYIVGIIRHSSMMRQRRRERDERRRRAVVVISSEMQHRRKDNDGHH